MKGSWVNNNKSAVGLDPVDMTKSNVVFKQAVVHQKTMIIVNVREAKVKQPSRFRNSDVGADWNCLTL